MSSRVSSDPLSLHRMSGYCTRLTTTLAFLVRVAHANMRPLHNMSKAASSMYDSSVGRTSIRTQEKSILFLMTSYLALLQRCETTRLIPNSVLLRNTGRETQTGLDSSIFASNHSKISPY
jgi:hypothetical protein